MRATSLPELSDEYPVSADDVRAIRRDGHILLRRVASAAELATFRPAILRARDSHGPKPLPLGERDTYGKAFLKGMNLWARDQRVAQFVLARRFGKIAADLLGVSGVRIYHDQALIKEPGGGITPWHQDQHYWPLETDATVTMWMPLVDVAPEMGSMHFASGSHRAGYLGDMPIGDESQARLDEYIRERGYRVTPPQHIRAGDATFHYGWTLHGAPGNATNVAREVMTIIWFADGARVAEPKTANQERDMERWLPGLKPGDLAASELNPLVYTACEER